MKPTMNCLFLLFFQLIVCKCLNGSEEEKIARKEQLTPFNERQEFARVGSNIRTNSLENKKQFLSVELLKSSNIEIETLFTEPLSSQFVLNLPNGIVVNEGGILTADGYILKDTQTGSSSTSFLCQHGLTKKERNINEENPLYFQGTLAIISSPGSENWFHWLLQILPRLVILNNSKFSYDRIYINNLKYQWQIDSLNIFLKKLNIPLEKKLVINADCIIQATHLIVPSVPYIPMRSTPLPDWLKTHLRSIFLSPSEKNAPSCDKIYISRAHASTRCVTNEPELLVELKKMGFKIVHLEFLSPYEQAQIFNNAKIIVGAHGSGFANLIFANKDCKVVEIDHGASELRSCYKTLSHAMLCDYLPFYVDQTTEDHLEDDLEINVGELVKFLTQLDPSFTR